MRIPIWVFFALFTVSGFAGLIYESIWSHYLKLFLGHAAYAQTLVLGIFMGGMALGAWLVGRYSRFIRSALLGYALVEFLIGVLALAFHGVFTGITAWAFDSLIPGISSPQLVGAIKWSIAAALILPASVLLGATFPLMSSGIMRAYGDTTGKCLPILYFTNSLGAALGVLASGFILIERFGLPGTIFTAGLLNVALALVVWALTKRVDEKVGIENCPTVSQSDAVAPSRVVTVVYLAAAITGAASFMFEIAWIRMLSLGIGAATHSFEVMLSAFILGISLGGLALSIFGHKIKNNLRALANVLAVKCFLALLAVAMYPSLLDLFQWLYLGLSTTENGYALYLLGSYGISGLMMIPTAFCAGMTLPLATRALLERGVGEKAIGNVYAANTFGAVVGTFAATHVGMELLGVKGVTGFGALIEVGLAVAVFAIAGGARKRLILWPIVPALFAFPAYSFALEVSQLKMASGVFRFGQFLSKDSHQVEFYRDGKTASISVVSTAQGKEIRTNGKTDAAIRTQNRNFPTPDEHTMELAAVLPYMYAKKFERIANIGFGSGLTTHTVLGNEQVKRLDSIEIESAIIEGAKLFSPINDRAYQDARSTIYIEDAKTFFSSRNSKYDVIISEPSNPWVSGVATLFSDEFYSRIKRHIEPNGLLVQWLQLYDTKPYIVASIVKALGANFSDYVIYFAHEGDAIIVATPSGRLREDLVDPFKIPAWKSSLNRLGYGSIEELGLLKLGSRKALEPLFNGFAIGRNSDYYPVVDLNAPRERFMRSSALELLQLSKTFNPFLSMLDGESLPTVAGLDALARKLSTERGFVSPLKGALGASIILKSMREPDPAAEAELQPRFRERLAYLRATKNACTGEQALIWIDVLEEFARSVSGSIASKDVTAAIDATLGSACVKALDEFGLARLAFIKAMASRAPAAIDSASAKLMTDQFAPRLAREDLLSVVEARAAANIALGKADDAAELLRVSPPGVETGRSLMRSALLAHAAAKTRQGK